MRVTEAAHISIASLINSSVALHSHLLTFLLRYVSFQHGCEHKRDDIQAYWYALGALPEYVDLFTRYNVWWNGSVHNFSLKSGTIKQICCMNTLKQTYDEVLEYLNYMAARDGEETYNACLALRKLYPMKPRDS